MCCVLTPPDFVFVHFLSSFYNAYRITERRKDMLSLSDQLTVPQVFFNDEHVGGATELFEILKQWDKLPTSPDGTSGALDYYQETIASQPDPIDERLKPSSSDDEMSGEFEKSDEFSRASGDECAFGCFILPNGNVESLRNITSNLIQVMPRQKLAYMGKWYVDCFNGEDGVTALLDKYEGINSREQAVKFGLALQRVGILHHVCNEHFFKDTAGLYFRLQPYHEPHVLNSYKKSTRCNPINTAPDLEAAVLQKQKSERTDVSSSESGTTETTVKVDEDGKGFDALQLVYKLRTMLKKIESKHFKSNGMDYEAALFDDEFEAFEEMACELQCVDVRNQIFDESDEIKFAFGINLYNLMIKHAFIKVGVPTNGKERGGFYGGVCYNVGGFIMSLDDVEHGMLRANTRHPYQLKVPFPNKSDERRRFAVSKLDPRIHFALNCGAKSCPPVSRYTVEAIDEELRIAAMSFLDQEDNMVVNPDKMEISLSMILKWYRADFCSSNAKLPEVLLSMMRQNGQRRQDLEAMVVSGKTIKIKYLPYDWSTDASYSMTFKSSGLSNTQKSFKAFLSATKKQATTVLGSVPRRGSFRSMSKKEIVTQ